MPSYSIRFSSHLNFSLKHGFDLYGRCLSAIVSGLKGILISPVSSTIPFFLENFVGVRPRDNDAEFMKNYAQVWRRYKGEEEGDTIEKRA